MGRLATGGRPGSPFDDVRPDAALAAVAAIVAVMWASTAALPGSRLVPVHLFTLGVVTPLVVAFSQHQAETVLRVLPRDRRWLRLALAMGAVTMVGGLAGRLLPAIAVGATVVSTAVAVSWWRLRSARRRSLSTRFLWLVRAYERAHGAFLHGALLGALLGIGVVPGWAHLGTRLAHLHAMVVGFGAVTLLATVVLYGPTLLRAQLTPASEAAQARWIRRTASAASVAVLSLLLLALPAPWSTGARLVAAVSLAVAAAGAFAIARPLLATILRKGSGAPVPGVLLTAAIVWLALGLAADAVLVATAAWRWFDALGIVVLAGALGQAIAATLLHVTVSWLPRERRLAVKPRIDGAPLALAALPQVAVVVVAVLAVG